MPYDAFYIYNQLFSQSLPSIKKKKIQNKASPQGSLFIPFAMAMRKI